MSNKQQTAVDFLVAELIKYQIIKEDGKFTLPMIVKAKEIEKENIRHSYKQCYTPFSFNRKGELDQDFLEYYNETYEQ